METNCKLQTGSGWKQTGSGEGMEGILDDDLMRLSESSLAIPEPDELAHSMGNLAVERVDTRNLDDLDIEDIDAILEEFGPLRKSSVNSDFQDIMDGLKERKSAVDSQGQRSRLHIALSFDQVCNRGQMRRRSAWSGRSSFVSKMQIETTLRTLSNNNHGPFLLLKNDPSFFSTAWRERSFEIQGQTLKWAVPILPAPTTRCRVCGGLVKPCVVNWP